MFLRNYKVKYVAMMAMVWGEKCHLYLREKELLGANSLKKNGFHAKILKKSTDGAEKKYFFKKNLEKI